MATFEDFQKLDIRVGTITKVEDFEEAKTAAYKVWVDFGELGTKQSSAQITKNYEKEKLVGKQVVCIVNFPKKQIANFFSEVLIMGAYDGSHKDVILLEVERNVENGVKVGWSKWK